MTNPTTSTEPVYLEPPHTWAATLGAGIWPKKVDIRGHYQIIGDNARSLVVSDMGGLIDIGGIHVTNPDDLDEAADRLHGLAEKMRTRAAQTAAGAPTWPPAG